MVPHALDDDTLHIEHIDDLRSYSIEFHSRRSGRVDGIRCYSFEDRRYVRCAGCRCLGHEAPCNLTKKRLHCVPYSGPGNILLQMGFAEEGIATG